MKRILVVEDSMFLRNILKNFLQDHYLIEESENGKDGQRKLQKVPYDLIITDLFMDEMDGITFLKHVRSHIIHKNTPVIVLSNSRNTTDIAKAFDAGANVWIPKPFYPDKLLKTIERLIRI